MFALHHRSDRTGEERAAGGEGWGVKEKGESRLIKDLNRDNDLVLLFSLIISQHWLPFKGRTKLSSRHASQGDSQDDREKKPSGRN